MTKQEVAKQARSLAAQVQKLNDAVLELPYEPAPEGVIWTH